MKYTREDIDKLDKVARIRLINAASGIKPANLIGTIDNQGNTNLAIFSSVTHIGSNPPLLGLIMRPIGEIPRHTYSNIIENESYTINHVHPELTEVAHYTSAKFDKKISEFERCGLTEEYIGDFKAPFVKESHFKMGMQYKEALNIKLNGTILLIGEIEHLIIPETAFVNDDIDLEQSNSVGISGLNSYYELKKIARYPYARTSEVPEF